MINRSVAVNINNLHNDENKPSYNGSLIGLMEVSPNGSYLVTYSEEDKTIVGWKFDESGNFKPDHTTKADHDVHHLRVSDKKILAYTYNVHNFYQISKYTSRRR